MHSVAKNDGVRTNKFRSCPFHFEIDQSLRNAYRDGTKNLRSMFRADRFLLSVFLIG